MKFYLFHLLLAAIIANLVRASTPTAEESKAVIARVYNLSVSLTDFEKDALEHSVSQLKHVDQKLRHQINLTDSEANKRIDEIQAKIFENFDNTVKKITDPKCVSGLLRSEINETISQAKEELKSCMEKAKHEGKHNHDSAKKHINLARKYMSDIKDALTYCNGTKTDSAKANEITECITKRFETLKASTGSEILEVRERVRIAMTQIPTILRNYHHCNKKIQKAAKRKLNDFKHKVHHCLGPK